MSPGTTVPRTIAAQETRTSLGLVIVSLAVTVVIFNNSAINVALPVMATDLALSDAAMRLVVVSYSVTFAALLLPAGYACGRWGARRALSMGLLTAAVGAVVVWLVPVEAGVIAGRMLLGAGAAFVMPATLAVAIALSPRERRSRAIAVWTAVSVAGAAGGPVLGGTLVSAFGWRSIFSAVAILAMMIAAVVVIGIPHLDPQHRDAFVVITSFLRICGVAPLIVAATVFSDAPVVAATCIAVSMAAWVVLVLRRRSSKDQAGGEWKTKEFLGASVANMLMFFAVAGSLFVLTQILQYGHGFSPFAAGLATMPVTAAMIVGTVASEPISRKWGTRTGAVVGLAVVATASVTIAAAQTTHAAAVIVLVAIAAAGVGAALPLVTEAMVASAPESRVGDAAAVNDTMQEIGYSFGVAVVGGVLATAFGVVRSDPGGAASAGQAVVLARDSGDSVVLAHTIEQFLTASNFAFLVSGLVVAVGAVVAWRLLPSRDAAHSTTDPDRIHAHDLTEDPT